ncbi:4'-phosphopantetheinyl transferase family protein [Kaarinaea lacus]
MILVNYTTLDGILPPDAAHAFLRRLPAAKANSLDQLTNSKQRTASILGLLLLGRAMEQLNVADFDYGQLNFSPKRKPTSPTNIEFNIAHSENVVACAVSRSSPLGIDSETLSNPHGILLHHVFNDADLAQIAQEKQSYLSVWVKKEAVAKATGAGVPSMKTITLDQEKASYKNQQWYLHRLDLDDNDISYLACQKQQPEINLYFHTFADCLDNCSAGNVQD